MFHDRQDLTSLIGSRICHDLISPLGAISNGLELLELSGMPVGPELDLITQSIDSAKSKIRFFRVTYGRAPTGSTLAQAEITSILGDYFKDARVTVLWHPMREVQRREIKIVFLAIQCLESVLPYGGEIHVTLEGTEWLITASSEKIRPLPDLFNLLTGIQGQEDLSAADVQFGMLAMLTQWRKPAMRITMEETSVQMRL